MDFSGHYGNPVNVPENNKDFKSAVTKSLELDGHQSQFHCITNIIVLSIFFSFLRGTQGTQLLVIDLQL